MRLIAMATIVVLAGSSLAQDSKTGCKSNAGSIYHQGANNPLLDNVARNVGDIVMIEISERSVSTFTASTSSVKTTDNNVGSILFDNFIKGLFGTLATSGSSTNQGSGDTNYRSSMTTQMSAIVKQVFPNGYMLIEGTRTLVTNKETQIYVLSGLIRPVDITADNIIDSAKIAEAQIRLESKGQIAERQRKGILSQLLDWIF